MRGGGHNIDSTLALPIQAFNIQIPISFNFCIENLANRFDKRRFLHYRIKRYVRKISHKQPKAFTYRYMLNETPKMLEDKSVVANTAKLPHYTYLCGYFQHLHCFSHIADSLLFDFTLKTPLSSNISKLKERILACKDSVFLHIRRGDYMPIPHFIKLASGYYNGALKAIISRINNPHIFVFSDDYEFAKNNLLNCLDSTLTSFAKWDFMPNNGNPAQIMELMRSCQHAIIANSTFSWWGAYLIKNPNKIIVMPSRFFYDDTIPKAHYIKPKGYIMCDYNWGYEV